MFYVCILYSQKDHRLYTGFTKDLKARFIQHMTGHVRSTKNRRPLLLIYYEACLEETDARKREVYLRGDKGKEELKIQLHAILKPVS